MALIVWVSQKLLTTFHGHPDRHRVRAVGVVHSFTGGDEELRRLLALGLSIGVTGASSRAGSPDQHSPTQIPPLTLLHTYSLIQTTRMQSMCPQPPTAHARAPIHTQGNNYTGTHHARTTPHLQRQSPTKKLLNPNKYFQFFSD